MGEGWGGGVEQSRSPASLLPPIPAFPHAGGKGSKSPVLPAQYRELNSPESTHPSLDKLSIFAPVGVPEVWRCDGERVRMLALAGDSYVEREQSLAFPALRGAHLNELLATSQQMPRTAWLRHVRAWAQAFTRSPCA
jgi:hypothetical protein